ncbi:MAG: hypothetical protein AMS17_07985 [Spirochaetes bacterium DG_61]|nr:MAG: hypothetical protein AMS17_07985 [Spirochaetes bacterium DG_61]
MTSQKDFQENFQNPSNRYGVAPFWFLNGELDYEELAWQVKEMKEKGLYGYVMHPRYGRKPEYLSEDWFSRIERIVKESVRHGMSAIIYDEDDWPSGMSGTKVLDDHPEYVHRQLEITWIECDGLSKVETDEIAGEPVAIFAAKYARKDAELSKCRLKDLSDITMYFKDGKLSYNNEKGHDLIFFFMNQIVKGYNPETVYPIKKGWRAQPNTWSWYFPYEYYVDLMDTNAVDYFIKTTHEEYKKRFGKYFGNVITQLYTDEPGFYTVMRDGFSVVPWSNILQREFVKEFGYKLQQYLPALVCDIGGKTTQVRHDFWFLLTKLFEENYVERVHSWCKRNKLQLTGHFRLCYPQLIWQRNYAGNVINLFKHMDLPGVDRLDTPGMCERLATHDTAWQIEDKILSSVGHQYGIVRRMSESFALGGWGYRFADMKRITDWQYMMGINFIVPHAFFYSISGQRKRECPPTQFYQNPMWENYKSYSNYICRLGEMMIDGINVADCALLYPMTSLWTDDVPKGLVDDLPNNIDRDFGFVTDMMLRRNLDYDVLGEEEFNKCKIAEKKLKISDACYSLLIVPPMTTVLEGTERKLIEFIEKGGKVLFLSLIPYKDTNGKALERLGKLIKDEFSVVPQQLLEAYERNDQIVNRKDAQRRTGQLALLSAGVLKDKNPVDLIERTVEDLIDRDFKVTFKDGKRGNIYYNHHVKDGKHIYFIHNSDEDDYKGYNLDITLRCMGEPYFYDPENGKIEKACFYRTVGNKTIVPYKIKPLKALFIVFEGADEKERQKKALIESNLSVLRYSKKDSHYELDVYKDDETDERGFIKTLVNGDIEEHRFTFKDDFELLLQKKWSKKLITENVLIIDHWRMIQDEPPEVDLPAEAWNTVFGTRQKYSGEFIIKEAGFTTLKAVFDNIPQIIYDRTAKPVTISCNGKLLEKFERSTFLDHDMREVDIKDIVKVGKNYIEIEFNDYNQAFEGKTGIEPVSMMWDSVRIAGDFTLVEDPDAENSYAIVKEREEIETGSWAEHGYPYFSGCMEYTQNVEIDEDFIKDRKCVLDAGDSIREYVEVFINGTHIDTRIWLPFRVDVTGFLKAEKNEITLRVRNTPKNIMTKWKQQSGIIGDVALISKEIRRVLV